MGRPLLDIQQQTLPTASIQLLCPVITAPGFSSTTTARPVSIQFTRQPVLHEEQFVNNFRGCPAVELGQEGTTRLRQLL